MQFSAIIVSGILAFSVTALPVLPAAETLPATLDTRLEETSEVALKCCYPSQNVCYIDMCLGSTTGFGTDAW